MEVCAVDTGGVRRYRYWLRQQKDYARGEIKNPCTVGMRSVKFGGYTTYVQSLLDSAIVFLLEIENLCEQMVQMRGSNTFYLNPIAPPIIE
jgi:hypothetical protein